MTAAPPLVETVGERAACLDFATTLAAVRSTGRPAAIRSEGYAIATPGPILAVVVPADLWAAITSTLAAPPPPPIH